MFATDLRHVVGVGDADRTGRIPFGAGLIAQYPEGDDDDADGAVVAGDPLQDRLVVVGGVGIELDGVHLRRPGRLDAGDRTGQVVTAPGRQDDGSAGREAADRLDPDLAPPAEQYHRAACDAVPPSCHGCSVSVPCRTGRARRRTPGTDRSPGRSAPVRVDHDGMMAGWRKPDPRGRALAT